METRAVLKNARISPQKCQQVADQIRNLEAGKALEILRFSPKRAAGVIFKLLTSALANAENNQGADVDALSVHRIFVDTAKPLKRIQPRARGRVGHIRKLGSHITVILSET